jgi:hypothetical protein
MPVTAIVRFPFPKGKDRAEVAKAFQASTPRYQAAPGLIRKYYLLAEDGATAGGAYLWESKAKAEAFYDAAWRASIKERFGSMPDITYFETPVIVDNALGTVSAAAE